MSSTLRLVLLVILGFLTVTHSSPGSRSILGTVHSGEYAVDLDLRNFDAMLHEIPASYAVVEFFAHCRIMRRLRVVQWAGCCVSGDGVASKG